MTTYHQIKKVSWRT